MDLIIRQLYLLLGVGAVVFLLTGGVIGYYIGVWKYSKIYKKYFENNFINNCERMILKNRLLGFVHQLNLKYYIYNKNYI